MKARMMHGIAACLVAATVSAGPAAAGERLFERSVPLGPGGTVRFDGDRGSLQVVGEDRNDVLLTLDLENGNPAEARERLDIEITPSGSRVDIRARFGNDSGGWMSRLFGDDGGGLEYVLRVPRAVRLEVDKGSGGTRVEAVDGDVTIDNGSGGVAVQDGQGRVEVDNGSGGVQVRRRHGEVWVDNGSGGVKVEDVIGGVRVENGSGGIRLDAVEGPVTLNNSSGGIQATLVGSNQGVEAETGSGGLRLTVPSDWGADLDLKAGSGKVSVSGWPSLDLDDADAFKGVVGGGGPPIRLRAGSGGVRLAGR